MRLYVSKNHYDFIRLSPCRQFLHLVTGSYFGYSKADFIEKTKNILGNLSTKFKLKWPQQNVGLFGERMWQQC